MFLDTYNRGKTLHVEFTALGLMVGIICVRGGGKEKLGVRGRSDRVVHVGAAPLNAGKPRRGAKKTEPAAPFNSLKRGF